MIINEIISCFHYKTGLNNKSKKNVKNEFQLAREIIFLFQEMKKLRPKDFQSEQEIRNFLEEYLPLPDQILLQLSTVIEPVNNSPPSLFELRGCVCSLSQGHLIVKNGKIDSLIDLLLDSSLHSFGFFLSFYFYFNILFILYLFSIYFFSFFNF